MVCSPLCTRHRAIETTAVIIIVVIIIVVVVVVVVGGGGVYCYYHNYTTWQCAAYKHAESCVTHQLFTTFLTRDTE